MLWGGRKVYNFELRVLKVYIDRAGPPGSKYIILSLIMGGEVTIHFENTAELIIKAFRLVRDRPTQASYRIVQHLL